MDQDLVQYLDDRFSEVNHQFSQVNARFNEVNTRFRDVNARFNEVDARFSEVNTRFSEVDTRFSEVDARFTEMNAGFNEVGAHFNVLNDRFRGVDERFTEVNERIEEAKRHNGVLIEGLRHELHLVSDSLLIHVDVRHREDREYFNRKFDDMAGLFRSSYEHLQQQRDQLREINSASAWRISNVTVHARKRHGILSKIEKWSGRLVRG